MTTPGYADCLVVVNGPEDGTDFPVTRAPFYVGNDPACTVSLRLDTSVRRIHAYVSVVPDGYRIRRADAAPVYVDGKRAGMVRSRILRPGGLLQVGQTLLTLDLTHDGLASRSQGMVLESDLIWGLREGGRALFGILRGLTGFLLRAFGRLNVLWIAVAAAGLYWFWPWFHNAVNFAVRYAQYRLSGLLHW